MEPVGDRRSFAWWLLAGLTLGLAAGDKYVGLLPLALALPPASAAVVRSRQVARSTLLGGAAALAVGGAVFFVANPTLYRRPLYQLQVSVDFLVTQARDMRRDAPAFASPAFVAVEMFDRAVWPTGYPQIVDRTLPEPLTPGSYGTSVVAFGAALGLLALLLAPAPRRAPLLAVAGGAVIVYVLLALSIPTWWERWHLPLIPPLCLLAGMGLEWWIGGQGVRFLLPAAQYMAALAMEPSFLGRGFGALALTPFGAAVHVVALALTLAALVSRIWRGRLLASSPPFPFYGARHGIEEGGR